MSKNIHRSGYVNIIGKPNVGKSTLLNALMKDKLSIVTSKVQTTRHRLLGILNGDDFQLIISDTPGIIQPMHQMHKQMMHYVKDAIVDADVLLFMTDVHTTTEAFFMDESVESILRSLKKFKAHKLLIINKIDLVRDKKKQNEVVQIWENEFQKIFKSGKSKTQNDINVLPVSALTGTNLDILFGKLLEWLPENEAYFPKDIISDKPEKFFVSEIIREQVFMKYRNEIPYSTEVRIESFKEEDNIIRIAAEIITSRKSQKGILIGKAGSALKIVGTAARREMEKFFGKKVFLEIRVKVRENWRNNPIQLKDLGFQ